MQSWPSSCRYLSSRVDQDYPAILDRHDADHVFVADCCAAASIDPQASLHRVCLRFLATYAERLVILDNLSLTKAPMLKPLSAYGAQ